MILKLALWASVVVGAVPAGSETVLFKNQEHLVAAGLAAAHTMEAIAAQARRVSGDQLTVTICLGQPEAPVAEAIGKLGRDAAAAVTSALPDANVSWVGRELSAKDCPRGITLAIWRAPQPDMSAALLVQAGVVHATLPSGESTWARTGTPILVGGVVETADDGRAVILLPDGSGLRLAPKARIKIIALEPTTLRLSTGQVIVRNRNSELLKLETPNAVIEFSKGEFRVAYEADEGGTTWLESFNGKAKIIEQTASADIDSGYGTTVHGTTVGEPRALPAPPTKLRPVRGTQPQPVELTWEGIEGVEYYRVEIATDIGFTTPVQREVVTATQFEIEGLEPGDYFWRVASLDADWLEGPPSPRFRLRIE